MTESATAEITGRLGRVPVLRYTPSGRPFYGVFVVGPNGVWIEVEMWDRLAERMASEARNGRPVHIKGRITYREWTEKRSKRDRRALVVRADEVSWIERTPPPAQPDPRTGKDE